MGTTTGAATNNHSHCVTAIKFTSSSHLHTIRTASDGQQALKRAEAEMSNLLLFDYHMPNMDGSTLAKQCGDLNIPFMFVTAESEWRTVQNIITLGALAYLLKPFTPQTCVTTVDEALRLASERALHKTACN